MGDAVIAAFFAEDKPKAREKKRAEVESWLGGSPVAWDKLAAMAATLKQGAHPLTPFHWEIEFPEVFARDNGGFDAIVGNPPFLGGKQNLGADTVELYIAMAHQCSIQPRHAMPTWSHTSFDALSVILRPRGCLGLIATNTIGQGDTRAADLAVLLHNQVARFRALVKRLKWPGEAAVIVSVVHIVKGEFSVRLCSMDEQSTGFRLILWKATLDRFADRLCTERSKGIHGLLSARHGLHFRRCSSRVRAQLNRLLKCERLIDESQHNAERIFPYIGGEEVNTSARAKLIDDT